METIICPKCRTSNPAKAVNCANCGINFQFALQNPDEVERLKREETRRVQGLPAVEAPKPDTELTTPEAAYGYAAKLLRDGWSAPFVESALVQNAIDSQGASAIVRDLQKLRADMLKETGKRNMLYGLLLLIGGALFTLASFAIAGLLGAVLVARGAIIFGALVFLVGLLQHLFRR